MSKGLEAVAGRLFCSAQSNIIMKQVWSCPQCLDGTFPTVGFDFSSSAFICHLCGTRLESLELTEDSVDSFPSPENAGSGYNGQHAGPPNILNSRGSGYILLPPGWKHRTTKSLTCPESKR